MKLHAVTMVRDEEDIIEAFVRHTLDRVDRLHVVVHQSLDGTKSVLQALASEGLPLDVNLSSERAFRQGATLTALAREAFRTGADLVFVIDADEFIRSPSREELEHALGVMPEGATGGIPWQTYVPLPSDDVEDSNVLTRVTHRRTLEPKALGKLVLGKSFFGDESLFLVEGAHLVYQMQGGNYVPLPLKWIPGMSLAHYPVRSVEQAVVKLLQRRWQRRIAWVDEPISRLVASGKRSTFDRLTEILFERGSLSLDELAWLAFAYNEDYRPGEAPHSSSYEHLLVDDPCESRVRDLRHMPAKRPPSLALYRWIDQLVMEGSLMAPASPESETAARNGLNPARSFSSATYSSSYTFRRP